MAIESKTSPAFIPRIVAEYVIFDGQKCKIRQTIVFETPFFTLLHFEVEPWRLVPRVLVVEPLSGIRAPLLFDMLTDIVAICDVYALIWTDPMNIRAEEGPFGMDDNIDAVAHATRLLGPGLHLIGLCQSALPALAATAILCASEDSARPASLTLLGGKLDTRINPAPVDRLTRSYTLDWFERNAITRVPGFHVGAGRLVFSASFRAMTLHFLLIRHMLTGGEIFRKILHDDGDDTSAHPFTGILMSPVAIPGEFFLDTVSAVFHDSALAEGRLRWRGLVVDPRAIMDVALLTIEAEEDDIAAPGQTYIAHTLCRTIPNAMRRHHSQPRIGHFGLFHGVVWRRIILPRLCNFLMEHQHITVA